MAVVEARINKEWAIRLIIIAAMFIGWGAYSIYDGAVAYPRENLLYELTHYQDKNGEWRSYAEHNPEDMEAAEWEVLRAERFELLQAHGFDPEDYDEPREVNKLKQRSVFTQFVMAAVCFPVGLLALVWWLINSRRRVMADDQAVHFAGRTMRYDELTDIDKTRWDSKGIVVLIAGERRMKLDDWKFRGVDAVLEKVERSLADANTDAHDSTEPQP